jgi:hypothetical protein
MFAVAMKKDIISPLSMVLWILDLQTILNVANWWGLLRDATHSGSIMATFSDDAHLSRSDDAATMIHEWLYDTTTGIDNVTEEEEVTV